MQEPECPWMFEEYRRILDNAERIKKVRHEYQRLDRVTAHARGGGCMHLGGK